MAGKEKEGKGTQRDPRSSLCTRQPPLQALSRPSRTSTSLWNSTARLYHPGYTPSSLSYCSFLCPPSDDLLSLSLSPSSPSPHLLQPVSKNRRRSNLNSAPSHALFGASRSGETSEESKTSDKNACGWLFSLTLDLPPWPFLPFLRPYQPIKLSEMVKTLPSKPQRKAWQHEFPFYLWWAIASFVAFLTLVNIARTLVHRQRRRSAIARFNEASEKNDFASSPPPTSSLAQFPIKVATAANKGIFWRDVAFKFFFRIPLNELLFTWLYCFVILLFALIYVPLDVPGATQNQLALLYSNRCGLLVFSQLPLIIGLASKNNTISLLTGISYEKLNFFHRSASRANLIITWLHVFGRSVAIPLGKDNQIGERHMIMGVVAFVSFNLIVILGYKGFLRAFAYEAFLISHIVLALLFVIGAAIHWSDYAYYVYPAMGLWFLDRFVRLVRVVFFNRFWNIVSKGSSGSRRAVVETVHGGALRLTLQRPMSWNAGQHAYLVCPTVSALPFEAHPFTIASIPSSDIKAATSELVFIVRVHDGFTYRLSELANSHGGRVEIPCLIDGPYGIVDALDSFHSSVLVAGGSGVTFTLPLAQELVRQAQLGVSAVRVLTFVWIIQSVDHLAWISNELEALRSSCPPSLVLDLKIFVTRSSDIPADQQLSDDASIQEEEVSSEEDSPNGSIDEKTPDLNEKKRKLSASSTLVSAVIKGRPDLEEVFNAVLVDAKGEPVSVNVCGPTSLSVATKRALRAGTGSNVSLSVENFGW